MLENVFQMLKDCTQGNPKFPPTILYNEGWLLRLVLDWYSHHPEVNSPLRFLPGSTWFSEALLPSAFLPRNRGDRLAEGYTHADGAIGHMHVGGKEKAYLRLDKPAKQFIICEAKLFSKLSAGTTHAPDYDQAARNVGCLCEVIFRAKDRYNIIKSPDDLDIFGFFVLAPSSQIGEGEFEVQLDRKNIFQKIQNRAGKYEGEKGKLLGKWLHDWVKPVTERINLRSLSWEEIIKEIEGLDEDSGKELQEFYKLCLVYNENKPKKK
jgi:hypothetical protein